MSKRIVYEIDYGNKTSAKNRPAYDTIEVRIYSGDPGGEDGEFEGWMRARLAEWYDGATVAIL